MTDAPRTAEPSPQVDLPPAVEEVIQATTTAAEIAAPIAIPLKREDDNSVIPTKLDDVVVNVNDLKEHHVTVNVTDRDVINGHGVNNTDGNQEAKDPNVQLGGHAVADHANEHDVHVDVDVACINDATQELLAQAATVAQEHLAEEMVSEMAVTAANAAVEHVERVDHAEHAGSILPSELSAEVAASAAAVAASLNHESTDLLLSSEIAQIAAESSGDADPGSGVPTSMSHEQHLASRRQKDRERYASMTKDQREAYNKKRREQYHRQSEDSRRKRRERERNRYHSLSSDKAKERNARRAALERERYKKLSPAELAARNAKRRERASILRARKKALAQGIDIQTMQQQQGAAVAVPQLPVQVPTAADMNMDLVRVYDSPLTSDLAYDALVSNHQDVQSTMQLTHDNSAPTAEENDESVAV